MSETNELIEKSHKTKDDFEITTEENADSKYNLEQYTVIIGIQILPLTSESQGQVLLTAGIKNELPLISTTTLAEIERVEAVAEILEKLKQSLPQIVEQAKLREQKQHNNLVQKQPCQVIPAPELQKQNPTPLQPSSQLSLF